MSNFEPKTYIHGSKLAKKAQEDSAPKEIKYAYDCYRKWREASLAIKGRKRDDIDSLVKCLDEYKSHVENIFDMRANSAQEMLQPTILEEFFEYLFCNIDEYVPASVRVRQPAKGFIDLGFNPKCIAELMDVPSFTIRRKDHDFVIGGSVNLSLTNSETGNSSDLNEIVIPAVAIECKRYLERNMLDECSGTANETKQATPYCLYLVVSEYLKMDDGFPELTKVDEIYVLRKQRNSDRLKKDFKPNPIDSDLVYEIFTLTCKHLNKIWWDPESALTTGKVFNKV